jgi:hypothetical protein
MCRRRARALTLLAVAALLSAPALVFPVNVAPAAASPHPIERADVAASFSRPSASARPLAAAPPRRLALSAGRFSPTAVDVTAVILSRATLHAKHLRAALRVASLPLVGSRLFNVSYYFLLTAPRDNATLAELRAENTTHGDLAFAPPALADVALAQKVHEELRNVMLRSPHPPRVAFVKLDDDSFVRWDFLLPELAAVRGERLLWGRRAPWGHFAWGLGYVMSAGAARGVARAVLPPSCGRNEDECIGKLARRHVARLWDDQRFFNVRLPGNRQPASKCWCARWPVPDNAADTTIVAHHVTPRLMREWAARHARLLNATQ